ncbi:unnamed protein product, partial [Trichogramma brassicae]
MSVLPHPSNISCIISKQDGAAAHYGRNVRNFLDGEFFDRWIGRRGTIEWPARSPDLTPLDFFLWWYLKGQQGTGIPPYSWLQYSRLWAVRGRCTALTRPEKRRRRRSIRANGIVTTLKPLSCTNFLKKVYVFWRLKIQTLDDGFAKASDVSAKSSEPDGFGTAGQSGGPIFDQCSIDCTGPALTGEHQLSSDVFVNSEGNDYSIVHRGPRIYLGGCTTQKQKEIAPARSSLHPDFNQPRSIAGSQRRHQASDIAGSQRLQAAIGRKQKIVYATRDKSSTPVSASTHPRLRLGCITSQGGCGVGAALSADRAVGEGSRPRCLAESGYCSTDVRHQEEENNCTPIYARSVDANAKNPWTSPA